MWLESRKYKHAAEEEERTVAEMSSSAWSQRFLSMELGRTIGYEEGKIIFKLTAAVGWIA